ncbi:hypothetical protein [uncultured Bradyrhizobium sp.]|uniref:hypothetical protein n=1 Tax=uncultured Bradyrhizobium sp. TaxID=199684 RepID=UPI0035CC691E
MNRIGKPFVVALAAIYFLADAMFAAIAHPLARWISEHWAFDRLRSWIQSLRPYPSLALFTVPLIILEPVKPVAAYLAATGQVRSGLIVLVVGEVLKLVLVERLFSLTRDKLLSIPAFAWAYGKYRLVMDWLVSTEAWQMVQRWSRIARFAIRHALGQMKASSGLPLAR